MNNLAEIRAKQADLAKAEKDTIAAIRAKLQQQKEELKQLEKRLKELGIEPDQRNDPQALWVIESLGAGTVRQGNKK